MSRGESRSLPRINHPSGLSVIIPSQPAGEIQPPTHIHALSLMQTHIYAKAEVLMDTHLCSSSHAHYALNLSNTLAALCATSSNGWTMKHFTNSYGLLLGP